MYNTFISNLYFHIPSQMIINTLHIGVHNEMSSNKMHYKQDWIYAIIYL